MKKHIRATVIVVFASITFMLFPVSAPAQQWYSLTGGAEVDDADNRVVGALCADGGGAVAMLCYQKRDVFVRLSVGETSHRRAVQGE